MYAFETDDIEEIPGNCVEILGVIVKATCVNFRAEKSPSNGLPSLWRLANVTCNELAPLTIYAYDKDA